MRCLQLRRLVNIIIVNDGRWVYIVFLDLHLWGMSTMICGLNLQHLNQVNSRYSSFTTKIFSSRDSSNQWLDYDDTDIMTALTTEGMIMKQILNNAG
jgi:hypothetical protein